jgi:hypothetical protein
VVLGDSGPIDARDLLPKLTRLTRLTLYRLGGRAGAWWRRLGRSGTAWGAVALPAGGAQLGWTHLGRSCTYGLAHALILTAAEFLLPQGRRRAAKGPANSRHKLPRRAHIKAPPPLAAPPIQRVPRGRGLSLARAGGVWRLARSGPNRGRDPGASLRRWPLARPPLGVGPVPEAQSAPHYCGVPQLLPAAGWCARGLNFEPSQEGLGFRLGFRVQSAEP